MENSLAYPSSIKGVDPFNIQQRMNHYGVPGVSIAVIKDFKIDWAKSYGIMDSSTKEAVSIETLFQAGSISKPVAAYGALKAVQDAKVDLKSPINDYLTSWKIPENKFTEEMPVSLDLILSHTAGLTVHGFPGYNVEAEIPSLTSILNGEKPSNTGAIRVFKTPGEGYKYSGGGYTVMQQMMIDQYGSSYPVLMEELVLGPLEMSNSTYSQPLPPEKLKMAATGYLPNGTMTDGKRHTYPEMAAAGLWTTATDLAKFAIDIQLSIKGERNLVLSQEMASKFTSPFIEDFVGLGIFLENKKDDIYFNHSGWDEGFSSYMVAHRDKGHGVVILTNSNHPAFIDELVRAVARVYNWSNYLAPVYEPQEISAQKFEEVVGRYKYDDNEVATIYREDDALYMKYLFQDPERLYRISDKDFIRKERTAKVRFAINPDNEVLYLTFPNEDQVLEFKHPKMDPEEILPIEHFIAGNYDDGEKDFLSLKEKDPENPAVGEERLNSMGYQQLWDGNTELAISIFKVNVALYPESANTYDSLGEAYMKNGDKELAIKNYRISLELNPSNKNAENMLKELEAA